MKKQDTTNTFGEGMIMDLNPLVTPNNVVTNCLNGTLITYNGNENVLLNDMGNGRVETAYLPEGYVPLGTAELGGIIYIVSYNPLIDKCLIGCFPSPERNITSDELLTPQISVKNELFQQAGTGKILNTILKVKLLSDPTSEDGIFKLNPGDKYTVYSTNNGVTNNKDYISDVGREEHVVDIDPRTITIHVVSIGEDGKIVYLDDSLKWTDASGNPAHYYIKECKQGNDIETDIDEYRSLVSSAYNIFNSKVSGELALLFELKVINTFSATWDADIKDIEGVTEEQAQAGILNKEATIHFNVNYTSDHKNINLKHILLTDSKFAGTTDMQSDPNIKTPLHCTLDIANGSRKNDGTDPDIVTTIAKFKYNSEGNLSDYIWNYALTPAMKFGYLDFLTLKGSINFLEIGSGKTELDEWRYFILNNNLHLSWGLSAYPEKNKKIDRVVMTFIPFDEVGLDTVFNDKEDHSNVYKNYFLYVISDKNSYSGYFLESINFGEIGSEVKNQKLKQNFLYLVDICIKYGSDKKWEYRHNYKWLYTTKQWNEVFMHNLNIKDFSKELTLDNVLEFGFDCLVEDNIKTLTSVYDSKLVLPRAQDPSTLEYIIGEDRYELPYATAGALITAVNYSPSSGFNSVKESINADVIAKCTSYPELFSFEKTDADRYLFALSQTYITHDDFVPKSDTRLSTLVSLVIPKVKELDASNNLVSIEEDLALTIKQILDEGIKTESIDNKAKDSFSASLSNMGNQFSINVRGAMFSRINADLTMKNVTIGQEIRPFLYSTADLRSVGLSSLDEFLDYFEEWHDDHGGGKPFYFRFLSKFNKRVDSYDDLKWDPTDDWTRLYWWSDVPPYHQCIKPWMLATAGCFQVMKLHGGVGTKFGNKNVLGKHILWAKTSEEECIPINVVSSSQADLSKLVAILFALLYYVNDETNSKYLPVVENINYMSNYSESWNVEVSCDLELEQINNNIWIVHKDDNGIEITRKSLQLLLAACIGLPIDISNIQKAPQSKLESDGFLISHEFYLDNITLYNLYDDNKSTTIPAIALLSTSDSWERCLPKTKNKVYVKDRSDNNLVNFVSLNKASSINLYHGGSLAIDSSSQRLTYTEGTPLTTPNPIFDNILMNKGELRLSHSAVLRNSVRMGFQSNASGHPWSYINNNSGYNLI